MVLLSPSDLSHGMEPALAVTPSCQFLCCKLNHISQPKRFSKLIL